MTPSDESRLKELEIQVQYHRSRNNDLVSEMWTIMAKVKELEAKVQAARGRA